MHLGIHKNREEMNLLLPKYGFDYDDCFTLYVPDIYRTGSDTGAQSVFS